MVKTDIVRRNRYEAPQAEELVLQIEECILSDLRSGAAEKVLDEETAGF